MEIAKLWTRSFGTTSPVGSSVGWSFGLTRDDLLPLRRLPEFDLVALRVDDPAELSILGVALLLAYVAALSARRWYNAVKLCDPRGDHERRLTRRHVVRIGS